MKFFTGLIVSSFLIQYVFAVQEFETVVTETKFNSSSRVVIDKEEIDKSHARNITSLLATQANISIVQSNFSPSTIFMRGGDSSHILILVDDAPFYDSSSVQRTINLNSIDIKSVQRIEVIKGSQSVLYGGQAFTGVIKIDTIPKEMKSAGQALLQAGNFRQTGIEAGGLIAITENFGVLAHGSMNDKLARSPVLDSDQTYPSQVNAADLSLVYRNDVEAILKLQTSFARSYISTTANDYKAGDAEGFVSSTYQATVTAIFRAPKLFLKPVLIASRQANNRQFEQSIINGSGNLTKQDFVGDLTVVRFMVTPIDTDYFNLSVGESVSEERIVVHYDDVLMSNATERYQGIFAKASINFNKNFQLEGGYRIDYRSAKDPISTNQVGMTFYEILKLEYATGFKRPSLFQRFAPNYGNPNLQPENSTTYSATLEGNINPDLFVSATIFKSRFDNLLITTGNPPVYSAYNADTQGVEFVVGYRWLEQGVNLNISLGYQEPKDINQGVWLLRRPLRTASLKVRKELDKVAFGIEVVHNGERRDRTGQTSYGMLNPYTLVHATAEYQLESNLAIFTRVQNIFNQRYESNYGYYDEGTNVIAGAEYTF